MKGKVLLALLYLYALIFSVLKTIRFPNEWSEAHWLIDYRFGFIKRGLAGQIFGFFFQKNEFNILLVSAVILLILYGCIYFIVLKQTNNLSKNIYQVVFYLVFFLSQYMVLSAHIIGYFDHIVFLLTILIIYLIRKNLIFLSSILVCISLLIHEISFFLTIPISLFALIVAEMSDEKFSFKEAFNIKLVKKSVLFLTLPVVLMFFLSYYQELYGKENYLNLFNYLNGSGFIKKDIADLVATSYTEKFTHYLETESKSFIIKMIYHKSFAFSIPILFLLFIVYREYQRIGLPLFFLFMIAVFFPLLLHFVAWDTYRIWAFPYMTMFLGYWILNLKFKNNADKPKQFPVVLMIISALVMVFLAITQPELFDFEVARFSLIERILMVIPILAGFWYFIKAPKRIF
ncbi:hypothetical protein [Chryseobacterium limigenitum]|uniref:EpsG family protein n=1 Tax=Chryseobacterium limigenitum TaxID=1612149 RepID=A0A1K2IX43_9FLAO|nr:hypothetical protein [Chryseobacterium limigenitum]SFZ96331.1 hypothetical protein SAMN05216324_11857 [Chryseobacterium limigenitum]